MQAENNVLFEIRLIEHHDDVILATLDINKDCDILKGHFPGQPVTPGACMLQIVKDVLEDVLLASLRLKEADQHKFIVMIDPAITHTVQLDLSYKFVMDDALSVIANII